MNWKEEEKKKKTRERPLHDWSNRTKEGRKRRCFDHQPYATRKRSYRFDEAYFVIKQCRIVFKWHNLVNASNLLQIFHHQKTRSTVSLNETFREEFMFPSFWKFSTATGWIVTSALSSRKMRYLAMPPVKMGKSKQKGNKKGAVWCVCVYVLLNLRKSVVRENFSGNSCENIFWNKMLPWCL